MTTTSAKIVKETIIHPVYKNSVVLTMSMRQAATLLSVLGCMTQQDGITTHPIFYSLSVLFPYRPYSKGDFNINNIGPNAIDWIRQQED